MTRSVCGYRIYPAWFGGDDMAHAPIVELAYSTADSLGKSVACIDVVGHGTNHRGAYIDFDVTYSTAAAEELSERDKHRAEDATRSRATRTKTAYYQRKRKRKGP